MRNYSIEFDNSHITTKNIRVREGACLRSQILSRLAQDFPCGGQLSIHWDTHPANHIQVGRAKWFEAKAERFRDETFTAAIRHPNAL